MHLFPCLTIGRPFLGFLGCEWFRVEAKVEVGVVVQCATALLPILTVTSPSLSSQLYVHHDYLFVTTTVTATIPVPLTLTHARTRNLTLTLAVAIRPLIDAVCSHKSSY